MNEIRAEIKALECLSDQERHNKAKGIIDKALATDGYSRNDRRRMIGQMKAELSEQAEQDAGEMRDEVRAYLTH